MTRNRAKRKGKQKGIATSPMPGRMATEALVDIVMPIFGEWTLAERAIRAIPDALGRIRPPEYRLIVVDNGTPNWETVDGTALAPLEQSKAIRDILRAEDVFVRLEQNIGYPGGVHEAVRHGQSPLILVLTADVFLHADAIDVMVREMDDPAVGVVGIKLVFPSDIASPHGPPGKIQHAGLFFDIRGKVRHAFIGWSPDHPKVNRRMDVAAVTGACLMTRRRLWEQIGGFDRQYGAGTFEDVDFCFAARAGGAKVIYTPHAVADHLVSGARLQGAGQGFNLPLNETVFRGKFAAMLNWDEWRVY